MGEKKRYHSFRKQMIGINLFTTILSLLICGGVFAWSVFTIVGRYIEGDIDFFLTETSHNLTNKMELLESIIYQIRGSELIMNYLNAEDLEGVEEEELQSQFDKVVNISSQKNLGNGNEPIVETVYLFDEKDRFLRTAYYSMIYSESEENKRQVTEAYEIFRQKEEASGKDTFTGIYEGDEHQAYLVYTLFDQGMEKKGVVVFELRLDVISQMMEKVALYSQAFWVLYDQEEQFVWGQEWENLDLMEIQADHSADEPFKSKMGNNTYLLYNEEMSLGLHVLLGVPQGQIRYLLYDSLNLYLIISILVAALLFALFAFLVYEITKPVKEFTEKLKQVRGGNFETKLPDYETEEFHEISQVFNEMTQHVNYLIKQVYEKQISIKEMELKFMQTQLNPHFMFNVLNTIALQAKLDGNAETYKMLTSFSALIQAKIYRKDTEKVRIRQEMEYVDYYLYLQSYRYGDRLNYHVQVDEDEILDMYMPKLCLQLIVENAVVHGIEPKLEAGRVDIRIFREEEHICMEVKDNGVGFQVDGEVLLPIEMPSSDKSHNHVGLNNAQHIIRLMYGVTYGVHIFSKRGEGSCIRMKIPFDQGLEPENKKITKK